jgi:hypothetical protein
LYVGTATQTEIIRINADDTWDLVIGQPRIVPSPDGGSEWKYPVSGLDAGFGHSLNDHAWQMDDPYGQLYIGTYNASIGSKDDPVYGPLLAHNMGAHLYRTPDGWYYSAITTNGFANPLDPYGGRFDYGIRTMAKTPRGAFLGTANDDHGLAIFRFRPSARGPSAPRPADRLEIEPSRDAGALLSWHGAPNDHDHDHEIGAHEYQIWRAEVHPIFVRDDLNFEAWNGVTGTKLPDTYVGPYEQIGVTHASIFIDSTVQPGNRYMYYVLVEAEPGEVSDQSNLVTFPLLTPPVTFTQLVHEVDRLDQRERFRNPVKRMTKVRRQIAHAHSLAERCEITEAIRILNPERASRHVVEPEATDLEILMSKLERRLTLFRQFPQDVSSDEFCTSP